MSTKNDGGPAFPVVAENGLGHIAPGMALRDWFAGQALPQVMATILENALRGAVVDDSEARAAASAYRVADAMLKAREA